MMNRHAKVHTFTPAACGSLGGYVGDWRGVKKEAVIVYSDRVNKCQDHMFLFI